MKVTRLERPSAPFAIEVERLAAHFPCELAVATDADKVWGE